MGYWHSLYGDDLRDQFLANKCDFSGIDMPNVTPICWDLLS